MTELFGTTPIGILILDVILLGIGGVLIPILWKIYSKLNTIDRKLDNVSNQISACITSLANANTVLAQVVSELNDTRVRDAKLEGRIKGLDEKLNRHIAEDAAKA